MELRTLLSAAVHTAPVAIHAKTVLPAVKTTIAVKSSGSKAASTSSASKLPISKSTIVKTPVVTNPIKKVVLPAGWTAAPDIGGGSITHDSSSSPGGTTPAQMRGAYGIGQFNSSSITFSGAQADGSGQTICIVDAYDDPGALSDLNAFSSYFSLPTFNASAGSPTFTKYGVAQDQYGDYTGLTSTLPGTDTYDAAGDTWEVEESLDIEWAHVMAPKANIVLVESPDSDAGLYYGDLYGAELTGVVALSNSWSGDEFDEETDNDFVWTTPDGHTDNDGLAGGETFLFATGDSGAYYSGATNATSADLDPQYPASSPNVLAVGGTRLSVGSNNTYGGETAWGNGNNSGYYGGGGGGVSQFEPQPTWQSGFANPYSVSSRTYPDVSLEADPNAPGVPLYDTFDFGTSAPWATYGGTSLACPMMAGIMAVVSQGRNAIGQGSLDGATQAIPDIYALASSLTYSTNFHDITGGNNGYAATTGYDLATGLGSVIENPFIVNLSGDLSAINGTAGNDTIRLVRSGSNLLGYVNNSANPFYDVPFATLPSLTVASSTGIDSVNVDFSGGATPVPASGLTVNGNAQTTTLIVTGTTRNDSAAVSSTGVTFNGSVINYSLISSIAIDGNGGSDVLTQTAQPGNSAALIFNGGTTGGPSSSDTLNVSAGTFTFAAPTVGILPLPLASLSISAAANVLVGTAASHANRWYLLLGSLSVAGATGAWTGKLDLGGNDLIIHNGNLAQLSNQTGTGFANGKWTGEGIASTAAAGDTTYRTALGTILNSSGTYGASNLFDGYAPALSDVLIKYTDYGDANLDGKVDGNDYSRIDNGYLSHLTGWANGDFNYDSHVDGSDYDLIDNAYNTQGTTL